MQTTPKNDITLPNLSLTGVNYGSAEPVWTLEPLLFSGGAAIDSRKAKALIDAGALGKPDLNRLPVVIGLHSTLQAELAEGGSRYTVKSRLHALRKLYSWADTAGYVITSSTIRTSFIGWLDSLVQKRRAQILTARTVAGLARSVATTFDATFEATELLSLCHTFRSTRRSLATSSEKASQQDVFRFGHILQDIISNLSVERIRAPLPVELVFRTGQRLREWSKLIPPDKVKWLADEKAKTSTGRKVALRRAAWSADTSRRTRHPLINLRVEAELLTFIAQTGMNLAQAHRLKVGSFSFQSHLDGYQVRRVFKGRRQGEVEFYIYSEYRSLFGQYLDWHAAMFSSQDTDLLFPIWSPNQTRSKDLAPLLYAVKRKCQQLGAPYFTPRQLRNVRVNWLVRRSRDPELTAEMAQHSEETLLRTYNRPSHQLALIEISRFHAATDPALAAPGPGVCIEARPEGEANPPRGAPSPDCISPAGCLFCIHHRDIDSADHAWSLASYRQLKSLELARLPATGKRPTSHPAYAVTARLTEKLAHLGSMSDERASWLRETEAKIEEGLFHPKWDGFIQLAEMGS